MTPTGKEAVRSGYLHVYKVDAVIGYRHIVGMHTCV